MSEKLVPVKDEYVTIEVEKGKILDIFINNNLVEKIEDYNSIVNSSMNTISQFTLVKNGSFEYVKTGLAYGRVQSGKTTYFLCTAACALDNGYDIIIILSGVTTNLLNQNWNRLKQSFKGTRTFLQFYNTKNFDTDMDETLSDIQDVFYSYEIANTNGGIFVSVLKNESHLTKVMQIVDTFKEKRILIIDDEGDQFTPNTKVNREKESTIFSRIKSLVLVGSKVSLLSVTATPQANVFADIYNELSPEFVEVVEPGIGYCGLETFHSSGKYITEITGDEPFNEDELRKAIIYYLFTIYETKINNPEKYKDKLNWMLIHNSRLKEVHRMDGQEVEDIIEYDLHEISEIEDFSNVDIAYQKYIDLIEEYFSDFSIQDRFHFDLNDFLKNFKLVLSEIYISKSDNNIHIINSDSEIKHDVQKTQYGILIGGDMLGRGITIDGLSVSYMTRDTISAGNIDTILQRARWFGYRENILDICQIFTTKEIKEKFNSIYKHDITLYDELKYCADNGIPLKESKLPTIVKGNLRVTRQNVIKKGTLSSSKQSQFMQQSNLNVMIDKDYFYQMNMDVLKMLNQYSSESLIKEIKSYKIESQIISSTLNKYLQNPDLRIINERLYESIEKLLSSNSVVELLIMKSYDEKSDGYSFSLNENISEYTVYTGNILPGSSGSTYEGDRYHFRDKNHIQIHFTKVKNSDGVYFNNGEKILFLCVNNLSVETGKIVQRVME